ELLLPYDVPVPRGRDPRGPLVRLRAGRRGRAIPAHARPQRALPDGLRRVRPTCGERGDQTPDASRDLDRKEHGAHARAVRSHGRGDRLAPRGDHLLSRVLPLESMDLPEVPGERARLPPQGAGELVPEG